MLSTEEAARPLTLLEVWLTYLRSGLPGAGVDALTWNRNAVLKHLRGLTPEAARQAFSWEYGCTLVRAMNVLRRDGVGRMERRVEDIHPRDLEDYVGRRLADGAAPNTVRTELSRLRAAMRHMMLCHPARWGERLDPTQGVGVPNSSGREKRAPGSE